MATNTKTKKSTTHKESTRKKAATASEVASNAVEPVIHTETPHESKTQPETKISTYTAPVTRQDEYMVAIITRLDKILEITK